MRKNQNFSFVYSAVFTTLWLVLSRNDWDWSCCVSNILILRLFKKYDWSCFFTKLHILFNRFLLLLRLLKLTLKLVHFFSNGETLIFSFVYFSRFRVVRIAGFLLTAFFYLWIRKISVYFAFFLFFDFILQLISLKVKTNLWRIFVLFYLQF